MTVEDILGLEKYGVFAVAANTISTFPLPGVTYIIREKRRLAGALCVRAYRTTRVADKLEVQIKTFAGRKLRLESRCRFLV